MKQFLAEPTQFMSFVEYQDLNYVELYVRGEFVNSEQVADQFAILYSMQSKYPEIHVYINSVGGNVATCLEMIAILQKFSYAITVSTSEISSAGFLLWSIGKIRVLTDHTSIMHHRESYMFVGKTQQHADYSEHTNQVFQRVYRDYLIDLITEEEQNRASYTEVYFSGKDFIDRGVAIHYDEFVELRRQEHITTQSLIKVHDVYFVVDDHGNARAVENIELSEEIFNIYDLIYQNVYTKIPEISDSTEILQENQKSDEA